MFLPVTGYDIPFLPEYDKSAAIALGLILGSLLSGKNRTEPFYFSKFDYPMLIYCLFCPILTSLTNHLGLYNGISEAFHHYLRWGVFFWIGRRYFRNTDAVYRLIRALIICGLIYTPLCLLELRISPQLHRIVYGFHPHSFLQQIRYGGYRPMVFMNHGIVVAFWMFMTFISAYWLWRDKVLLRMRGISLGLIALILFIITITCKTASVWTYLLLFLLFFHIWKKKSSARFVRFTIALVLVYILIRNSNILSNDMILSTLSNIFDEDRIYSLSWRLRQEVLFGQRTLERPLFGWGGYRRGWPVNVETGEFLLPMVDSQLVIISNTYGYVSMTAFLAVFIIGPWISVKKIKQTDNQMEQTVIVFLSTILVFFLIDCTLNAMDLPLLYSLSGILMNYAEGIWRKEDFFQNIRVKM